MIIKKIGDPHLNKRKLLNVNKSVVKLKLELVFE